MMTGSFSFFDVVCSLFWIAFQGDLFFVYASLYPPEVARNVTEIIRVIQGLIYKEATGLGVPAYWQPRMTGILSIFNSLGKSNSYPNIIIHA